MYLYCKEQVKLLASWKVRSASTQKLVAQSEKVTLLKIRPRSDGIWMLGVFNKIAVTSSKGLDAAQLVFHQYGKEWLKELIDKI